MTESDNSIKRWRKAILITLGIFLLFWIGHNLTVVLGTETITEGNIADVIADRYQECGKVLAIVIPNIYAILFYYIFGLGDAHVILRYGRRKYEKIETLKMFISSVIFVFEYFLVDIVFMTFFGGIKLLTATSYYQFIMLEFIMMTFYIYLIGMTLYFLRNFMKFNRMYMLCGAVIYSLSGILYYVFFKEFSPAFYMNFSTEWFNYHSFDSFTYIINLAKLFFASLILKYLGELVFLRRDIWGNEEN